MASKRVEKHTLHYYYVGEDGSSVECATVDDGKLTPTWYALTPERAEQLAECIGAWLDDVRGDTNNADPELYLEWLRARSEQLLRETVPPIHVSGIRPKKAAEAEKDGVA